MKIALVEDEREILRGMELTLKDPEIGQVLAFDSPVAALEAIEREKPEIIITDIVMDGMTGLELIGRVRQGNYNPKCIVVSGYSHFEYARKSVQLGVLDYILKPFDREEFRQKLRTLVDSVQREQAERKEAGELKPYLELGAKALRDKFVLGLCLRTASLQEHVYHRLKYMNLEWLTVSAYMVAAIDCALAENNKFSAKELDLRRFAIGNIAEELIGQYWHSMLLRSSENEWIVIGAEDQVSAFTQKLAESVETYQKYPIRIGISERAESLQSLPQAFEQAKATLKFALMDGAATAVRYAILGGSLADQDWCELLVQAIASGDVERIRQHVELLLNRWVVLGYATTQSELQRMGLELIVELNERLSDRLEGGQHIPIELWERIEACVTLRGLQRVLEEHCHDLFKRLSTTHIHAAIEQTIRWIDAHLGEEVTLRTIAERLSLHPVWLSQLFKRETGVTFSDYVVEARIERAKSLLRETPLKIYEIATAVGYADLQHFGQMFKKKTGVSPKEYRFGK